MSVMAILQQLRTERAALGPVLLAFDSHSVRLYRIVLRALTKDVNFDTFLISTFVDFAAEACVLTDFMETMHCGKTLGGNISHTGSQWITLHDHFGCMKFQGNVHRNLVRQQECISDWRLESDNDAARWVFFAQLVFQRPVLLRLTVRGVDNSRVNTRAMLVSLGDFIYRYPLISLR
jgi:hypothetical protein